MSKSQELDQANSFREQSGSSKAFDRNPSQSTEGEARGQKPSPGGFTLRIDLRGLAPRGRIPHS